MYEAIMTLALSACGGEHNLLTVSAGTVSALRTIAEL